MYTFDTQKVLLDRMIKRKTAIRSAPLLECTVALIRASGDQYGVSKGKQHSEVITLSKRRDRVSDSR